MRACSVLKRRARFMSVKTRAPSGRRFGRRHGLDQVVMNDDRVARVAPEDFVAQMPSPPAPDQPGNKPAQEEANDRAQALAAHFFKKIREHVHASYLLVA